MDHQIPKIDDRPDVAPLVAELEQQCDRAERLHARVTRLRWSPLLPDAVQKIECAEHNLQAALHARTKAREALDRARFAAAEELHEQLKPVYRPLAERVGAAAVQLAAALEAEAEFRAAATEAGLSDGAGMYYEVRAIQLIRLRLGWRGNPDSVIDALQHQLQALQPSEETNESTRLTN